MKIQIDTKEDSKEDLREIVRLLSAILSPEKLEGSVVAESNPAQSNDKEAVQEMFNMFNTEPQASQKAEKTDEIRLEPEADEFDFGIPKLEEYEN